VPAAIISDYNGLGWVLETRPAEVTGPDQGYAWKYTDRPSNINLIMDINGEAMKTELFNTLNGYPQKLKGITN
jgi:hypothetical protein